MGKMAKVEVNIVILNDNPNVEISFVKDNQIVLWDALTAQERARIMNALASAYSGITEDFGKVSIQLR